jgi:mutator protein MutT
VNRSSDPVEVAIGVIAEAGRVLVRRREGDPGMGEVWEFPGGKIDAGEDPMRAAVREVREETGLRVRPVAWLCSVGHAYPDRRVQLHAFLCVPEEPASRAGLLASLRWVHPDECAGLGMPAANAAVLQAVRWYGVERPRP